MLTWERVIIANTRVRVDHRDQRRQAVSETVKSSLLVRVTHNKLKCIDQRAASNTHPVISYNGCMM